MTKKKSKRTKRRTEYMSVPEAIAFLDRWAAERVPDTQAEVNLALLARSATRVLKRARVENVRDPVQIVAKWMASGAAMSRRGLFGRSGGRPVKGRDASRAMIQSLHRLQPASTWYVVTRRVADHFRVSVRRVRRHGEHAPSIRWDVVL
ncbi:MAG: hypothetical protein DMD33_14105 [Gemmatimonadetes bacterium]|nr:MAG: hypothetical protein DMD33_14105 [Gemmatimonadota bacterium]